VLKPQVIETPSGEKMAVLPLGEYERLVAAAEDAADARAFDEAMAALASGQEELMPSELANRIIEGESPVRVWRVYRGLALRDLARRAGISPGYLSEIERGRKSGSIEAISALAAALGLRVDDLI
jgi:DNA-binding XRE family transcriptional regulator